MVGESDTVSPSFSNARTGLLWIGGFFFIFLTIAVVATLFNEISGAGSPRSASTTTRASSGSRQNEPSMGLTPETATSGTTTEP